MFFTPVGGAWGREWVWLGPDLYPGRMGNNTEKVV